MSQSFNQRHTHGQRRGKDLIPYICVSFRTTNTVYRFYFLSYALFRISETAYSCVFPKRVQDTLSFFFTSQHAGHHKRFCGYKLFMHAACLGHTWKAAFSSSVGLMSLKLRWSPTVLACWRGFGTWIRSPACSSSIPTTWQENKQIGETSEVQQPTRNRPPRSSSEATACKRTKYHPNGRFLALQSVILRTAFDRYTYSTTSGHLFDEVGKSIWGISCRETRTESLPACVRQWSQAIMY